MSDPLRVPRVILAASLALLVAYLVIWSQISRVDVGRSDFTSFYVGGTLLRAGDGADLYNEAAQQPVHSRLIAPDQEPNLPFVNPPVAAAVVLPATLMPLPAAFRLWALLELAVLTLAVVLTIRAVTWPPETPGLWKAAVGAAALASMGTWTVLMQAQWTPILALGIAIAYSQWKRDRLLAGSMVLIVAAGMAKPQLAIGIVAFMLGWRGRRVVIGGLLGAMALGVVCLALVGWSGISGFAGILATSTTRWDLRNMLSFVGVVGALFGNGVGAHVVGVIASVVACAAAYWLGTVVRRDLTRLDAALAGAVVLSLLAAPHAYSDDLVMLAPAAVIGVAVAARRWQAGRSMQLGVPVAIVLGVWALTSVAAFTDLTDAASFPPGQLTGWALVLGAAVAIIASRAPRLPSPLSQPFPSATPS